MWKKIKRNILRSSVRIHEKLTRNFVTLLNRPQKASEIGLWSDKLRTPLPKTAITIQGPLHEDNFTYETVKLYRKLHPEALIIVSTWTTENEVMLRAIEKLGATIVRTPKPEYAGPFNENMQIVSSREGLKKAKELGAKYALKSRSDQRMYAPNALEFMHSLIEAFPYKGTYPGQKKRLVTCSKETLKYRPYGVTDMILFGDVDDVLNYWDCPLDMRPQSTGKNTPTVRAFMKERICEIYFATEYMKKIGREPKWTLHDSWDFLADHIVIADQESLDIYWRKYDHWKDSRFTDYASLRNNKDMRFRDWLNLYMHRDRDVREDILDLPFRATIPAQTRS